MLSTALTEGASNIWGIEQAYHASKKVYRFLNAENNVAIRTRYGEHGVSARDMEEYIDFFDFVFNRSDYQPENRLYCNYSFDAWKKRSNENINPLDFSEVTNNNLKVNSPEDWKIRKIKFSKKFAGFW